MRTKLNLNSIIHFYIIVVYLSIFCIPIIEINNQDINLAKYFFVFVTFLISLVIFTKYSIEKIDILVLVLMVLVSFFTNSFRIFILLSTVLLYRFLRMGKADYIRKIVLSTRMNYVAVICTAFYSLYYFMFGNFADANRIRFARVAIRESNESGLAILCLGMIIRKKNKVMGDLVLAFGCFTLSRNYYLALLVIIIFSMKNIEGVLSAFQKKGLLNFSFIMIFSGLILIIFANLYINWFRQGDLYYVKGADRLFVLKDLSNYFRFSTNGIFLNVFFSDIKNVFFGIPDTNQYIYECQVMAQKMNILYLGNTPHNFMLSYLRLYGLFSLFILNYINKIIKEILNKDNISIYLAICIYAIFLSAGFNLYFLYLTIFVLCAYNEENIIKVG